MRRNADESRDKEWEWALIGRNGNVLARSVNDFRSERDARRSAISARKALIASAPVTVKS